MRLGNFLEACFRGLVPRIQVRMVLPRQLAEGLANVLLRSASLEAEDLIVITVRNGSTPKKCVLSHSKP